MLRSGILLLPALLVVGCLDLDQEFTVNPDGSGKVAVKAVFSPVNMMGPANPDPEVMVKQSVKRFLEGAKGIDSWGAIAYKLRDDGKVEVKGTAWFEDLSAVRLQGGGFNAPFMDNLSRTKDDDGNSVIEAVESRNMFPRERNTAPAELTEEQIKKRLIIQRAQYKQSKPMMQGMLNELRIRTRLVLPTPLTKTAIFKKKGDRAAERLVDGTAMLKVIDALVADDAFLTEQIKKGRDFMRDGPGSQKLLEEKLFGEKGPARVVYPKGGKPLFDYKMEVAKARKEFAAVRKKFGMIDKEAPPKVYAERNPRKLLTQTVVLDLAAKRGLRAPLLRESTFQSHLQQCLSEGGLDYSLKTPTSGSSISGSSNQGSIRLVVEDAYFKEYEFRSGGDALKRLSVIQNPDGTRLTVMLQDDSNNDYALLVRDPGGKVKLVLSTPEGSTVRSWPSFHEASRRDPVTLGERFLPLLREFPIGVARTPADPEVAETCLRWNEAPDPAVARKVRDLTDQLSGDDLVARVDAAEALEDLVKKDVRALRLVLSMMERARGLEVKARLRDVAGARKDLAAALTAVTEKKLYRDPVYLAALTESGRADTVERARKRLAALLGREFRNRAEFEAWYATAKDRLIWDEKSGRYGLRR